MATSGFRFGAGLVFGMALAVVVVGGTCMFICIAPPIAISVSAAKQREAERLNQTRVIEHLESEIAASPKAIGVALEGKSKVDEARLIGRMIDQEIEWTGTVTRAAINYDWQRDCTLDCEGIKTQCRLTTNFKALGRAKVGTDVRIRGKIEAVNYYSGVFGTEVHVKCSDFEIVSPKSEEKQGQSASTAMPANDRQPLEITQSHIELDKVRLHQHIEYLAEILGKSGGPSDFDDILHQAIGSDVRWEAKVLKPFHVSDRGERLMVLSRKKADIDCDLNAEPPANIKRLKKGDRAVVYGRIAGVKLDKEEHLIVQVSADKVNAITPDGPTTRKTKP